MAPTCQQRNGAAVSQTRLVIKKQKQQIIGMSTREHKLIGKSVDFYDQRWNLKFFFKQDFVIIKIKIIFREMIIRVGMIKI